MRFFRMGRDYRYKGGPYWGKGVKLEMETCSYCKNYTEKRNIPLHLVLPNNRVIDFVWSLSECTVTDKVKQVFEEEGFTGCRFSPVVVDKIERLSKHRDFKDKYGKGKVDKSKVIADLPVLWEIIVTGDGGEAHPDSGLKLKKKCDHCFYKRFSNFGEKGLVIDEEKWDGSDFFKVFPIEGYIIVTERVKKLIESRKLKNVILTPVEELGNIPGDFATTGRWEERNSFLTDN